MSAAAGGSFKSGFISAGLTAGLEVAGVTDKIAPFFGGGLPGNAIAGALIGGVGSSLTGGSFRRGAEIGAMSQLFNACNHGECDDLAKEIGTAVLEMVPGVTAFQCLMNDCGPSGWAMAVADFTPVGKIAKIAKWGNRAHKALSVDKKLGGAPKSPNINPKDVANKTPEQIDVFAKEKGLIPKGPNPQAGQGAYVDPVTGNQRVLCHTNCAAPHSHVNNPQGQRLNINGDIVAPESPAAHLPINYP